MSPQFVDFDGDGHIDILAATFAGSPYLARGSAEGFAQPEPILDRNGERIVLNQYWDFDSESWEETARCDPEGGAPVKGQGTSAWAVDWDRDGDLDLLLGDYEGGHLYLRRNEATSSEPAFAPKNELVLAAGKPIDVGKMSTPRLVDWNGDGTDDLLVGSMGDAFGEKPGGGVFVFPGIPGAETLRFDAPITLIEVSRKGHTEMTRPDSGLYMDLGDYDGDGDLDLIVGGYAHWTPPAPPLTEEQKALVEKLEQTRTELLARSRKLNEELYDGLETLTKDEEEAEREKRLRAQRPERTKIDKKLSRLSKRIRALVPGKKRLAGVWLYENLGAE